MNNFFTLALLNAAAMAKQRFPSQIEGDFLGFAAEYGRDYKDVKEMEKRLGIFQLNSHEVQEMNKKSKGVTFKLNEFSDMNNVEFRGLQTLDVPKEVAEGLRHLDDSSADEDESDSDDSDSSDDDSDGEGRRLQSSGRSLNWGVTDYMAGVKSQKNCGSCWAFAATSVQEGVQAIKSKTKAKQLSE